MQNKQHLKSITILLALFVFAVVMSLMFNPSAAATVITYNHGKEELVKWSKKELLKGQSITGEFKAKENYLGILSFRFHTFERINDDFVFFKIKQHGQKSWFYKNLYKVDQFQPDDFFTFGFPIISNSENKTFDFSIQSTAGKKGDAIAASDMNPVFATKYQFPKGLIIRDPAFGIGFLIKKTVASLLDVGFYSAFFVFSIPIIFYLIWIIPPKKPDIGKYMLLGIIVTAIIVQTSLPSVYDKWIFTGILGILMLLVNFYNIKYYAFFLVAAGLLAFVMAYFFLLIGALHLVFNMSIGHFKKNES